VQSQANTTTNQLPIVKTIASELGQEGGSSPSRTRDGAPADATPSRPARVGKGTAEGVLRGFVTTPDFILAIAPIFRDWLHHPRPSWEELTCAAFDVRSALGVSQHAWGQAVLLLGGREAVVMLAAIAARHARGLVHSPGGLLRRMVELHQAGELRLDRTLFGLADALRADRQRSEVAGAGQEARP
jgi:hypothetical protein